MTHPFMLLHPARLCFPICHGAPRKTVGLKAPSASVNEPHSFLAIGIWHVIVLGHRGRSDAICWHVGSQHKLSLPLCPRKKTAARQGQPELHSFISRTHTPRPTPHPGKWPSLTQKLLCSHSSHLLQKLMYLFLVNIQPVGIVLNQKGTVAAPYTTNECAELRNATRTS